MKNSVKKLAKLIGILTAVVLVTVTGIYFFETRTIAHGNEYKVVTADVETESQPEINTTEVQTTTAIIEDTEKTAVIITTEADTEAATEAETIESTTEPATEIVTEAATEEVTVAATVATPETEATQVTESTTAEPTTTAPSIYTDVIFKDGVSEYHYNSLEEAKASINVATLSDAEARQVAATNKQTYQSQVSELVDKINEYRTANGLTALALNDNLTSAAMHRAAESAYSNWNLTAKENGTKRHIRPNYEKASSIGAEYGISGNFGENYGRYQANADEILEDWQNSSAHNALLLSGNYSQIGIGVAADSEGYLYWIAIFN